MPVFLRGRRAFLSSLRRRHRRCNPLSVHRVTNSGLAYPRRAYSCRACPAAAAACHSYSHLASHAAAAACHSYPHFAYFAAAALGYRSAARTATPPAWSEMPPRPVFLQLFYGTSHSRSPSLLCPGHKKADGTALRSVRRQKATNLSRQHHRGSSSTRQVSARA